MLARLVCWIAQQENELVLCLSLGFGLWIALVSVCIFRKLKSVGFSLPERGLFKFEYEKLMSKLSKISNIIIAISNSPSVSRTSYWSMLKIILLDFLALTTSLIVKMSICKCGWYYIQGL